MEKAVDFTRLEKNIIEVIQEEQIKLGYRSELIRLYYPITSLNRFFHTDAAEKEMSELLAEFSKKTVQTLGGVEISNKESVSALQFRRAVLIMCMNTRTEVSSFPVL